MQKKLGHEFVTLEHPLFAMTCSETFYNPCKGFGADVDFLKSNLEHHLKNEMNDIKIEDPKYKPKNTNSRTLFEQSIYTGFVCRTS